MSPVSAGWPRFCAEEERVRVQTKTWSAPLVCEERNWVRLNVSGVVCLLILKSMKGVKKGGWKVSVAENGIRVNDQVCPRGVVHIKAISAVTALATWPDWLITKRCSNRNNNKCQSVWRVNNPPAAVVVFCLLLLSLLTFNDITARFHIFVVPPTMKMYL